MSEWSSHRLAAFALPFLLLCLTAFMGGGDDELVRGQVSFLIWWIFLLAAIVGVVRLGGIGRAATAAIALLAGYAAWTGASVLWSEVPGDASAEAARLVGYLGVLAGGTVLVRAGYRRELIGAVAAAISLVGMVALLSRLHPQWFPVSDQLAFLPEGDERLSYPLNYWNGVATMIAIGIPLVLNYAAGARYMAIEICATAILPALVLAAFLTFSRGGSIAIMFAIVVLIALRSRRPKLLLPLSVGALGGITLIALADAREAFSGGVREGQGITEANEMLVATIVIILAAGTVRFALHPKGLKLSLPTIPREPGIKIAASLGVAMVGAFLLAGGAGWSADRFDEFKQASPGVDGSERLSNASGNGRYQWWSAAVSAGKADPVLGLGAGSFEPWWARTGEIPGFVRDAHSVYLESFGELGVLGLLLIVGLVGMILVFAVIRTLAAPDPSSRAALAAATAGAAAFALTAAIDWSWEQPVLAFAFLLLGAATLANPGKAEHGLAGADVEADPPPDREGPSLKRRGLSVAGALVALAIVTPPLAEEHFLRESKQAVRGERTEDGLDDAEVASSWQPWASAPYLQQALVHEVRGELDPAVEDIRAAVERSETDWRLWFVLARIEGERSNQVGQLDAFRRARELNPRSPLFDES